MAGSARRGSETELPKRIGRYEAFFQIGAGGMARVYLGLQRGPLDSKKLVVIKHLRPEIAADEQFLAQFGEEARIALRLDHPNVVNTYEVVVDPPDRYLSMEYLYGQSLMEVLRRIGRENVPLEEHVWILTNVLAGLHYAHELRGFDGKSLSVIHRDVSPANVVVSYHGSVKLVDFGIARAAGALVSTREGVVRGKVGYAAPEQCLGIAADRRSDVYAVGVMLWEAMARRRRSTSETWPAMLQARVEESEPRIEDVWPEAPSLLVAAVSRALARDPAMRYASAREFQRDLERYLAAVAPGVGADSVAALLGPHFAAERAAVGQAIEDYVGAAPAAVSPAVAAGETKQSAISGVGPISLSRNDSDDEDRDTSPIPVDRSLLLATKLDQPLSADGFEVEPLPAFRARRAPWRWAAVSLAVFGVASAAVIFSARRSTQSEPSAPLAKASPVASSVPVATASVATSIVATSPSDERADESADESAGDAPASRRTGTSSASSRRTRPAKSPPPARVPGQAPSAPTQLAPGMDLRTRSTERAHHSIDDKDPYAP